MSLRKQAAKSSPDQHGSHEATEHDQGCKGGVHRRIVTRLSIYCDLELQSYVGVELLTRDPTGEKLLVILRHYFGLPFDLHNMRRPSGA
jgi:hypothetical protein